MPSVSQKGTVSWPGAAQNGREHTLTVSYTWTSASSCTISVTLSGGCDDAAGSSKTPGWGDGVVSVAGANKATGLYITAYTAAQLGLNNVAIAASSAFKVKFSYFHQYSVAVKCSEEVTIPYSPPTYTVSYNANGHGSAPASQTKTYGTNLTLKSFIDNVVGSTSSVTITGNANGGTWSGSNGSATYAPTYSQTYWNTKSDGSGTNYSSGATYTTNAAITLYAIWKTTNNGTGYTLPTGTPTKASTSVSRTVTFNANGGSTTKSSQASTSTTTYSFKGWFTATTGGTQRTTSSRVTAAETVYAQYDSSTSAYSSVTLPTTSQCTRSGYVLAGFATSSTADYPTYTPGSAFTPTANITLYAVWSPIVTSTYSGHIRGFIGIGQSDGDFKKYIPWVYNGTAWQAAIPYVYDGGWVAAGQTGELMLEFLTSAGENFVTSDGKIFMVRKQ